MESQHLHIIPFLSKELNLLGYSKLPYTEEKENILNDLERDSEKKNSTKCDRKNSENVKISFNSKEMIRSLVGICFQLVNDMKLSCQNDKYSDDYDRMRFENCNLQKQVDSQKRELEKKMRIISDTDEKCRQLKEKLNELEEKIKILEKENLKNIKKHQLNEDIMKHQRRKSENDLFKLHKVLYNEKNIIDMNYLPENFDIVQEKQPNFKKLWSDVKYSSVVKKEEVLKKAICIYQQNNEILLEDNALLKTLLFLSIEEINELVGDICTKLKIPCCKIDEEELQKVFMAGKSIQARLYKDCLKKELSVLTKIFEYFDESGFCVGDNLYVPLTDVICKLKSDLKL